MGHVTVPDDRTGLLTLTSDDGNNLGVLKVLGAREDGQWCAIALELSVRGYGSTFRKAFRELGEAVEAHISFALQHDSNPFFPAEPDYFTRYDRALVGILSLAFAASGGAKSRSSHIPALENIPICEHEHPARFHAA